MHLLVVASVSVLSFAALPASAAAQTVQQNEAKCVDDASPDLQIEGCTAFIQGNQVSGSNLAFSFTNRGSAYTKNKDYEHAIADFNEAIRLDPQDAGAFLDRGILYKVEKDYARALADYDEALRLNPELTLAYYDRGNLYGTNKDYAHAIADFDEALRLNPQYVMALLHRSIAENALGRTAESEADLAKARSIDPNVGK